MTQTANEAAIWPPVFDRRPSKPVGQENFPARATLEATDAPAAPVTKRNSVPSPSNQNTFRCRICGQFGACTAYGSCNFLRSVSAVLRRWLGNHAYHSLYHEAQFFDEWKGSFIPGPDTYEGSSANGVALAMRDRGWINEFTWTHDPGELARAINVTPGGVLVASNWYAGMMRTDSSGVIRATGTLEGGHMFHVPGYDAVTRHFEMFQSWGPQWGVRIPGYRTPMDVRSFARIPFDDMGRLLAEDGEGLVIPKVLVT